MAYEGGSLLVPAPATDVWVADLAESSDYAFRVTAIDHGGRESTPLALNLATSACADELPGPGPLPPTKPGAPVVTDASATSVSLTWPEATDPDGTVANYEVFQGSIKLATTSTTTATISGLRPLTDYAFHVVAVDDRQMRSTDGDTLAYKTPDKLDAYAYSLRGSTAVKPLVRGRLPLTGGLDAELAVGARTISGELSLGEARARLSAVKYLPLSARVSFVSEGTATGSFTGGGVLKVRSAVRLRLRDVRLFNIIRLAGGSGCQSKAPTDLELQSPPGFELASGGQLTGTYSLGNLGGCGVLNGVLSPLTSSSDHPISLTITPAGGAR